MAVGGMGYILLWAVAGSPGNKNNKEINTPSPLVLFTQLSVSRHKQEIHTTNQQQPPSWTLKKYPENYLIYVDFGFLPHNDPNGGWYI